MNWRGLIAAALFTGAFLFVLSASAHDSAEWIQRGAYKNAVGELCCGVRDCFEIEASDVKAVDGGYLIKSTNEFIPHNEAQPSPGGYWRCQWGGQRKCFFSPVPGS